jgi:hypothetical protein
MQPTGEKKTIVNWSASQMLLKYTILRSDAADHPSSGYRVVSDVWLSSQIDATELLQFYRTLAERLGVGISPFTLPTEVPAQFDPGMDQLNHTLVELPGMPVQQTLRLEFTPPAPTEPDSPRQVPVNAAEDVKSAANSDATHADPSGAAHGDSLKPTPDDSRDAGAHRLLMFGAQRKKKSKSSAKPTAKAAPATTTVLIIHSTLVDFSSTPLDADLFNLPTGYQQSK